MLKIEKAKTIIYITIALTFLFGIIVAVRLTMSITKPARELVNATRVVASGNLGHTVSHKNDNELGEIASNFNTMSIALRDNNEKLLREITEHKKTEDILKESQSQLRNLSRRLQELMEEERTHIARDIHDELGQALTALQMDLSWLSERLPEGNGALIEKTQSMTKIIHDTIQQVENISSGLRPSVLDHLGLAAAFEWQAKEFQSRTGIPCEVTVEPEDIILDKVCSTAVFRILQEALTNVARHAEATRIKISMEQDTDRVILIVSDNGKGITREHITNPRSFGIMGIRERVNSLKGEVTFHGAPNQGTMVKVVVPLYAGNS